MSIQELLDKVEISMLHPRDIKKVDDIGFYVYLDNGDEYGHKNPGPYVGRVLTADEKQRLMRAIPEKQQEELLAVEDIAAQNIWDGSPGAGHDGKSAYRVHDFRLPKSVVKQTGIVLAWERVEYHVWEAENHDTGNSMIREIDVYRERDGEVGMVYDDVRMRYRKCSIVSFTYHMYEMLGDSERSYHVLLWHDEKKEALSVTYGQYRYADANVRLKDGSGWEHSERTELGNIDKARLAEWLALEEKRSHAADRVKKYRQSEDVDIDV